MAQHMDSNVMRNFTGYNSTLYSDTGKNNMVGFRDADDFGILPISPDNNRKQVSPLRELGNTMALGAWLSRFTVALVNGTAVIKWTTAMERQIRYFAVERSTDGRLFCCVGLVAGQVSSHGGKTYDYTDQKPNYGINYYRLRLVDVNGNENLSRIAALNVGKNTAAKVDLQPNPFFDKIRLRVASLTAQELYFKVLDIRGIARYEETLKILAGTNTLEFDFSHLPTGVYMFTFTGTDSLVVKRLLKK